MQRSGLLSDTDIEDLKMQRSGLLGNRHIYTVYIIDIQNFIFSVFRVQMCIQ
jgi:hypothetical protein